MVNVAILGFGTVGSGVAEVLTTNGGLIDQRVENLVRLKYILDVRDFPDSPYRDCFVKDFGVIESDPEVDIVVETIGGATVALDFTTRALKAGKSVVSSNKELVATHGYELLQLAREHGVSYLFEASVGGGDENGNPMLNANGKKILKSSYSVLQDDFFHFMRAAGYTDVKRGERGSTEEHLTVTQFKVQAEQQRLEAVTGQVAQAEQSLENAKAATEKQKRKLEALQKETKTAKTLALTVQDIEAMGKKATFGNNITLTPDECRTLKDYAVSSFAEKAEKIKYKQKFEQAEKSAKTWKQRYDALHEQYQELKKKAQPFLDALEIASERVRAFLDVVLSRGKETQEHKAPARKRGQDMEL